MAIGTNIGVSEIVPALKHSAGAVDLKHFIPVTKKS